MLKKITDRLRSKRKTGEPSSVEVRRPGTFIQDYDRKMEAITLAEANAYGSARRVLREGQTERPKIAVVAKQDTFQERVRVYAIQLAERLGYEIVAMNVGPIGAHAGRSASGYAQHLRDEFMENSIRACESFRQEAIARGIHFHHIVKFGDVNKAIENLHHEIKRLELLITGSDIAQQEASCGVSIPTFSIAG